MKVHKSIRIPILIIFSLIVIIGMVSESLAANHYIRPGATGSNDGTDWTNAWTAQPARWVRGDTYYYADGEINEYILMNVADSGTDRITLKKATAGDHGTETGWSAGYGDGTFTFTATTRIMLLWSSYVTIDGQVGGGPGSWTTGYGFKFSIPDSTNGDNFSLIDTGRYPGITNLIITHVEFKQAGMDNWEPVGDGYNNHQSCIKFLRVTDSEISYCYLHEASQTLAYLDGASNLMFEYNYLEHRSGAPHGEAISCNASGVSSGNIFRYNIFKDCSGTGIIVLMNSIQGQMYIYGNIIYSTDRDTFYTTNGTICNLGSSTNNDILVYNNTMVNLGGGNTGISYRGTGTGNIIHNNLWYNCNNISVAGGTVGYSLFSDCNYIWGYSLDATDVETTGDPFVDWENEDFRLKAPTAAGITIDSPFHMDMNGVLKGTDGVWDRGAFEFESGSIILPTISSVTITPNSGYVKVGSTVSITVTAGNNEAGLTPSNASINGKAVPLADQGNGTYTGTYTVMEGDNESTNVEATNITLTGSGGPSAPASSSGSTLTVDGKTPTIISVTIFPDTGDVTTSDNVIIIGAAGGNETGLTASNALINGRSIPLTDQGNGTYRGIYTVGAGDNQSVNIEAANITLTDAAGNVSGAASSSGSSLSVVIAPPVTPPAAPTITTVSLSPNSGSVKIGGLVTITVTEGNNEAGLTPSNATFNGKQIPLSDQGNGTYIGNYVVAAGDNDGTNIDATNITLTGAGGTSDPAASSGSTLKIDAHKPAISSVALAPNSGLMKAGDSVTITVTAAGNETGLNPSNASINGKSVPLTDQGNGTYRGIYTVLAGDNQGVNINATNITLTDTAGNISVSASSSGSTLKVDTQAPSISSVTVYPNFGWLKSGASVDIYVTEGNSETGLTASNASINGKSIALTDQGNGTYSGIYTAQAADTQGVNINATGITLTDAAGNVSATGASSGSTLKVDTQVPVISSVTISPNSGELTSGDNVTITAIEGNSESGLTVSNAQINGRFIPLSDQGGGTYSGTYFIGAGDNQGINIEATNITLTDAAGNVSNAASSSGSTLSIVIVPPVTPPEPPTITSVTLSPNSGYVKPGNTVTITVTAGNNEVGLIPSNATFNSKQISLADQGNGTYIGVYTINEGDTDAANANATNITLTGIGGTSAPTSSSGSTLFVDANTPSISSVTITPNSGWLKTGETLTVTATATNNEASLTASDALINGKSVPLADQGNGTYRGTYTAQASDAQGVNIEASNITLSDAAGNLSNSASSVGSTLDVDTQAPSISSVTINPNSGTVTNGENVTITVTAGGFESGLISSNALINGKPIVTVGQGNGTYRGMYTVSDGDNQGTNIEATGITLTDAAGNVSLDASSSGSTLSVVVVPPVTPPAPPNISSVTIIPNSGYVKVGDLVAIIVTAQNNEAGLTASNTSLNGKLIPLSDQGEGSYIGNYIIAEGDNDGINVNATNITLTGSGGTSTQASSTGSTLRIDAHTPSISSVAITPNSGWVNTGDQVNITVTASSNEIGLSPSNTSINGKSITLIDMGNGTYRGIYTVQPSDNQGINIQAKNITLSDAAGNMSNSASSTGSSLIVDTLSPAITSVTITPNSGSVTVNGTVIIMVSAQGNEAGLTASNAYINGNSIPLIDIGGGSYKGTYIVKTGDIQGTNIEATNITLIDKALNTSATRSSTGSTLSVINTAPPPPPPPPPPPGTPPPDEPPPDEEEPSPPEPPTIASVIITPNSGYVKIGDYVRITVTAGNNEVGLIPSSATFNGMLLPLLDRGNGTYDKDYKVTEGDNDGINVEATNITLTGEGGTSEETSSTGSTLNIDANTPSVSSVAINPNTGWVTTGDRVDITVTALGNEAGLSPSYSTINGKYISLSDHGDGTYTGTYTIGSSDEQDVNIEATNITLTDAAGNKSNSASSSGSTLKVDTNAPRISSVRINPNSGEVTTGNDVVITVTAGGNETGLTASNALINGKSIPLVDLENGKYSGVYTVEEGDEQGVNIEATGITLTDIVGNVSNPDASTGSTLSVNTTEPAPSGDTQAPAISSVTINPVSGTVTSGEYVVITVRAGGNETGLTASAAEINGKFIPITELTDGLYRGYYFVQAGDEQGVNIEARNITLEDNAGNVSQPASSSGSTLSIATEAAKAVGDGPEIASVTIAPNTGWVAAGDTVYIDVVAVNEEKGLTPSNATINGKSIPLAQKIVLYDAITFEFREVPGTYSGVYVVNASDPRGINVEATGITLSDTAGNPSSPASSTGSTLKVYTAPPEIASVVLVPTAEKAVGVGQSINIVVTAVGNEAGLTPSDATINNSQVPLYDEGDGTYRGVYVVQQGDSQNESVEATNITLSDATGNVSAPASSSNSGFSVKAAEDDSAKADFNADGTVNLSDLVLFGNVWGATSSDAGWDPAYDLNGDNSVNLGDLVILGNVWNVSSAPKTMAKAIAKPSPVEFSSDVVITMSAEAGETASYYNVMITLENFDDITGFGVTLSYNNEALEFQDDSIEGLVGLSIVREEAGIIALSSLFMNDTFGGTVTLGFKSKDESKNMTIELIDALVSNETGVSKITELTSISLESLASINIIDLVVSRASEWFVVLSWTAPAGKDTTNPVTSYMVEMGQKTSGNQGLIAAENQKLTGTPKAPGESETFRIDGLKPGLPYYISVKSSDDDSLFTMQSNVVTVQTLIGFIDDDLDPSDPYIIRDDDSLFVADNDESLKFVWSSWEAFGAVSYKVSIGTGSFDQLEQAETVQDTTYIIQGEPGETYALEVIPVNASGNELGVLRSRLILCSPADMDKPGKPEMVESE